MNATLNQKASIILSSISFVPIALPLAYLFSFHFKMGISGIWLGLGISLAFLAIAFNLVIVRVNWEILIEKIRKRTRQEKQQKKKFITDAQ